MKADKELIEYIRKRFSKMVEKEKEATEDQELSHICYYSGKSDAFDELLEILEEK